MEPHFAQREYRCGTKDFPGCGHEWVIIAGVNWKVGTVCEAPCPRCGKVYTTWKNHPLIRGEK